MSLIVYTGPEHIMSGYKFNGVYWEEILNTAELHQKYFDELYNYYETELFKYHEILDKTTFFNLQIGIKKINSYVSRTNIIKVFQTTYYTKKIEWNMNKDLFVFEDCVYDLKEGSFVEPNPDEYVNRTCGYKYTMEFKDNEYKAARNDILDFVEKITGGIEERDYLIKTYSRGLKQHNELEKAYFIIGTGRNGKGTNNGLMSNALGNYFGYLNIENYTHYKKSIDEPNQNLYDNRYSRILSTSETSDVDSNGKTIKFIIKSFQDLTGNDIINARELGTKNVAYFKAGIPILDVNFMIDFTQKNLDSIRERIDIQETPFTFTSDEKLLKENPAKYKPIDTTLKSKFNSDIYRRAMIDILFEYYQKDVKRPDSVKRRTDAYFNEDTLESWIRENCIESPGNDIRLDDIKECYKRDTEKNMTIKSIKTELLKLNYNVKLSNGYNKLKDYKLKEDDE